MSIQPRSRDTFIQLVIRRRSTRTGEPTVFLRAVPETAQKPTRAQLAARITLGEVSRNTKGRRGFTYDPETGKPLPGSAVAVKLAMKGEKYSTRRKTAKWERVLREYFRQQGIDVSIEELRKTLYTYLESK
ncbi:MAG: hypothetical protein JHC26_07810 [Thermofilum sp.]|uniref:hypothetical protein n=1 Tax=Thermofilum sp. TaxID=1961369 RepID=UPI00258F98FB|nr:hypothetical protein [Thermofilum sp.]MCI4408982.1 hypothetical protein [Thermofilum sp.]